MKYRNFYILILLLLFSITTFAQNKPAWVVAIEKTIGEKETDWKIESKIERDEGLFHESIILKSNKITAAIEITLFGTITNPKETFDAVATVFDKNMGKFMTKTKLENFGDQGFIWKNLKEDDGR